MRRKIGIKEIEDMALGATVLGAGGGGDPYVGKLMAIEAIKKYGEVELISPDEVPDDAVVCVSQMMGAPTIMVDMDRPLPQTNISPRLFPTVVPRRSALFSSPCLQLLSFTQVYATGSSVYRSL